MVDSNKLRGIFREKECTIEDAAKVAGISTATMTRNLKKGIFGSDEIERMIVGFEIKNPMEIFFADKVKYKDTLSTEAEEKEEEKPPCTRKSR